MEHGIRKIISSRTARLAATYLAIIMALTMTFSVVIYGITSAQLDKPLPERQTARGSELTNREQVRVLLVERADEAKLNLAAGLALLNGAVLVFGAWFSVVMARRAMAPIKDAMERQSRFVADASHEIRTPLTTIRSANEVALRRKKITDKEARQLATQNIDEITKLHNLTSSLLGLVSADRGASQVAAVSLQGVVSDVMGDIVAAAQAKNISVQDNTANVEVLSNKTALTQVVRILLDNAVKYSPKNSNVDIFTTITKNKLTLSVQDRGAGIADADLPHIFERFYRADSSRSKSNQDGFGVGLAIAKSISDQYQMNIAVKSKLGQGATFKIELPLNKPKPKRR